MNISEVKTIKVAILAEEPMGWPSGKHYFPIILNNHTWNSGSTTYKFSTEYIYDKDIIEGKLSVSNFDVLLVPGGGVGDAEAIVKSFNFLRKVRRWKRNIKKYIEDGGSYVGICGGATLFTDFEKNKDKKDLSFFERHYNNGSIGVSCIKHYYKEITFRYMLPFQKNPAQIGAIAYVFSFAPGETKDNKFIHTAGVPVDFELLKNNPIFSDFQKDTIRVRWWGGPALILPENPDREINVLTRYPKKEFSLENKSSIFVWKYTGGFFGLFKSFCKSLKVIKANKESLKKVIMYTYYFAQPWEKTDEIIDLDFSEKPSIVTEIYPNKNKGRIVLCTSHPEYMIWWDGYIEEVEQNKNNCVATGFHKWKEIKPLSKNTVEELTYTWWIVQKLTAWAAKVPDDQLPPITKQHPKKMIDKVIKENIFWDGTLHNQIENI